MIKRRNRKALLFILLILAMGVAAILWIAHLTDKRMRRELLEHARITAYAVNIAHIAALSGSEKDLNTHSYLRIKSQLSLTRSASPKCRFLYLMGQRPDGTVFFFVDSLSADSEDYAPPGLVYEEVPDSYLHVFDTTQEAVVGPVTDRWGTLITALIPLTSRTGSLVAVLGMDIDASDWNRKIFGRCVIPFTVMVLFISLILLQASRYQAVKSYRESEDLYRQAFHTSPDSINLNRLDDGVFIDINAGFTKIMGYTPEDVIGESSLSLNIWDNPEDRERLVDGLKKIGHVENLEARLVGKNGKIRTGLMSAYITKIGGENIIISITRDITHWKQTEDALRESEEKFRSMMEAMKDPVYICSPDYRVEYMNPTMIQRAGHDATGELCFKALHDLDKKCPWCMHHRTQTNEHAELDIVSPKDNRSYHLSQTPIIHGDGSVSNLNVFRDTTDLAKMETQLRQAQKMEAIGTLAGGIAHDFNNILFGIFGYLEMAIGDTPEDSPVRSHLEKVFTAAQRAGELVKQILTFSRQSDHELKPLQTQLVIKEALKLIKSSLPSTIEISHYIRKDCGPVLADPTQIHQIVMNLCTNAYHAMEKTGGKLKITLKEVELTAGDVKGLDMVPGPHVCLTVADTGPGMDQSVIARIFDPYFTTKETGKGTGLGLAVVHGIVKSHGGHISVYSEPGKGTEFHVYLPVIKNESEPDMAVIDSLIQKGTERILLVDDEDVIVQMGQQMLERLGYHVTTRTGSMDALALFQTQPGEFDLVITDMTMPNMTGDKLAGELMKIRPDIPIILCTGFSELVSKENAAALGIKGFLMKPMVMKDLSSVIRKVLDG